MGFQCSSKSCNRSDLACSQKLIGMQSKNDLEYSQKLIWNTAKNCGRGLAPDSGGSVNSWVTDTPLSGCTDGDILYKRDRGHPLRFWVLDSRLAPLSSLPSG